MKVINVVADIARKHPETVWRARHFKHFRKMLKLNVPFADIPDLTTYVSRTAIANGANARWALMADKYAVRQEVASIIGEQYLIPLLGHWERPEDIDFDALPEQFILKTNNGCGTNIFVHDKSTINRKNIIAQLKKDLAFPYPELTGQLHYSLIKPCVIAEKLMTETGASSLTDYKIHCVNGEPAIIYRYKDRDEINHFEYKLSAYTPDWQQIAPYGTPCDVAGQKPDDDRPELLDEMLGLARKLAAGEEYVRADFYIIDNQIYFGEMTYTPDVGGNSAFKPYRRVMDYILDRIKSEHK